MMNRNVLRFLLSVFAIVFSLSFSAHALGPHELLVLVNKNSSDSVEVARKFASLRGVPKENLVFLDMAKLSSGSLEITQAEFTSIIWEPALRAARERKLDDHIQAWVYSSGFPIRIKTSPPLSILGVTFLRNNKSAIEKCTKKLRQLSEMDHKKLRNVEVDKKLLLSPLFSDPIRPGGKGYSSQTLDGFKSWYGEKMPLPSMMLGYVGPDGNTLEEVVACLERSSKANLTGGDGKVYFVTSADVRSKCRAWQYCGVQKELSKLGVSAVIADTFPSDVSGITGLMMGAPKVDPGKGNVYLPGSMAEHLTSAAAAFGTKGQTKLSVWISAGASASAGTVTEPYSLWPKFTHARFFVHYASGCTMLESFYQSIRSPMQILLVGDPLVAPWAPDASVEIVGIDRRLLSGVIRLSAITLSKAGIHFGKFTFLMDGRIVGDTTSSGFGKSKVLEIDTSSVKDGAHDIRVVAYSSGLLKHQIFAEKKIVVENKSSTR